MEKENKTTDEQIVESEITEDNLIEELIAFNSGEEGTESSKESDDMAESEGAEQEASADSTEDNADDTKLETSKDESVEEESKEEDEAWLIKGKFRDDEKGRADMAKSYRDIQGMYDKTKNESNTLSKEVDDKVRFADWVARNPDAIEALKGVNEGAKVKSGQTTGTPEKPEDFDSLDIFTEGTSSNEWYQSVRESERTSIIGDVMSAVKTEVDALEQEDTVRREQTAMHDYLKKEEGMSDDDIESYNKFMSSDDNVTPSNLVRVWRILTGQHGENETSGEEAQNVAPKNRPPSAAAVSGSTPPPPSAKKEEDDFFKNLMQFSK